MNSGGCTLRAPPPEHGCYALGMQRCDLWSVSGQRLCTCYREGSSTNCCTNLQLRATMPLHYATTIGLACDTSAHEIHHYLPSNNTHI